MCFGWLVREFSERLSFNSFNSCDWHPGHLSPEEVCVQILSHSVTSTGFVLQSPLSPLQASKRKGRQRIAGAVHRKVAAAFQARPARAHPSPASYPGPTDPALRAYPFPEITAPICRLPLPTLFYRLEAVHLGDLLPIWVRPVGE
ncbi:unnamed protein product [Candidula unifasciata]|uniref:Uncharacterized protein n=1 Tax=Candidula unifasciata TaxID=100452 RepID=A0A8S3Z008_9EUPU|nr:unnamed protein product [Candidula unifasciata]